MSQRIDKLRKAIQVEKYPLCMEKNRLWTKSFKSTEGEPQVLRRAKALAEVLDNITIFIEEGELIVGNSASKPMGLEVTYWSGLWPQEEIEGLKKGGYELSEELEAEILAGNEYWRNKNFTDRAEQLFDDRLWPFMEGGVILPPWKKGKGWVGRADSGMGLGPYALFAPDYELALKGGLNKVIQEAEKELRNTRIMSVDSVNKVDFLKAVIISHKAVIRFARRFAELATNLAAKESEQIRKIELERIAAICQWIPANPARNFHEAIQFFWFVFLVINPNMTVSLGRFDQYMYPYYEKDKLEGTITDDEVLELLQCLRIKDMQLNRTSSQAQREKWAGMAKWHNCIIGGQTADGKDATNELSFLILEAARKCPTPHHTITLRVHEGTPDALMLKALEVVRAGIGMPAFVGDKSYIKFLLNEGVPLEDARDYILAGCIDTNLPGKSRIVSDPMFVTTKVLEFALNDGVDPKTGGQVGPRTGDFENFASFDEFMEALKKQFAYCMELEAEENNIKLRTWAELMPDSFASALMENAIKEGKPMLDRKFAYENGAVLNPVGMINVADSLAAIKKLVFEEKKVTPKQLKAALHANWKENGYENMRKMFLAAPKYGNDDDYVDTIARDLYRFWADTASSFDNCNGGKQKPSGVSISAQWPAGALTGATPDGRRAGECVADGAMSAMRGMDTHGPTALIKSSMKIDQASYQAALLNMKLHPSSLKTTQDLKKLSDLIRTYFEGGGKHVQFNVVDRETLLDAQKNADNHKDLIVRVAGYSAYFVQLGQVIQNEVIARTEHQL